MRWGSRPVPDIPFFPARRMTCGVPPAARRNASVGSKTSAHDPATLPPLLINTSGPRIAHVGSGLSRSVGPLDAVRPEGRFLAVVTGLADDFSLVIDPGGRIHRAFCTTVRAGVFDARTRRQAREHARVPDEAVHAIRRRGDVQELRDTHDITGRVDRTGGVNTPDVRACDGHNAVAGRSFGSICRATCQQQHNERERGRHRSPNRDSGRAAKLVHGRSPKAVARGRRECARNVIRIRCCRRAPRRGARPLVAVEGLTVRRVSAARPRRDRLPAARMAGAPRATRPRGG